MTLVELVEAFGAAGLMIGGLAMGLIRLWNRYVESQDGRFLDLRESNIRYEAVIREYARSLDQLTDLLKGRRDG